MNVNMPGACPPVLRLVQILDPPAGTFCPRRVAGIMNVTSFFGSASVRRCHGDEQADELDTSWDFSELGTF